MSYHQDETYSKTIFGFWIYLLSDFVLFGTLFATYAVLRNSTYGGPTASQLFHSSQALIQTLILLTVSFTSGIGKVFAHLRRKKEVIFFYFLTFFLALIFITLQLKEWNQLVDQGYDWKKSAFLSAFFTLIGTHALHLFFALAWSFVLLVPVWKQELNEVSVKRLTCLTMFWQFLNLIWIFIFAIVYLLGGA